ncbi:WD40/YVTN/BNR-like repeat-containing protein [Gorillibacterium massiliense]|uniref:WD40/YVTN/BNR-like repeat-containing protein n=1 Tax=Gorillibacterium massiliense TaxID=1280390 RepID=UPI0004BA64B3|nr:hypothetical protein [Gorillibacterium massiliense]
MKVFRKTGGLLLGAVLVLGLAGCGGGNNAVNGSAAPTKSVTGTTGVGESAAPSLSPSPAEPTKAAGQPSVSTKPTAAPANEASTKLGGIVTALRLADANSGWAGGEGWIARTDDGGKTWLKQMSPASTVQQIFALNGKTAWATLGSDNTKSLQLFHTTDGGTHWTETGTVPNRAFFHFVTPQEAFSGQAHTVNDGKTWTELPVPAGMVGDPYFHDANNGWAVTQESGKFHISRTEDSGKTWRSVMTGNSAGSVNGVVIRSTGKNDAWVELIGDSGMSQTSYSLFHTADGGKTWIRVLANDQAGSGPAPGFGMNEETKVPRNTGNSPGALYVVNPQNAFMGGQCLACDNTNTMGKTTDGGKTWVNQPGEFPGYGKQQIAAVDAEHVWLITTDASAPSVLYTSSNGGKTWSKVHTFSP